MKKEFPKGKEHINCENGLICPNCAWTMVANGRIDAFEFCLERIRGTKTTGECAHESREKCAKGEGAHAEMQRYIFRQNKALEDLEKEIIDRQKME